MIALVTLGPEWDKIQEMVPREASPPNTKGCMSERAALCTARRKGSIAIPRDFGYGLESEPQRRTENKK